MGIIAYFDVEGQNNALIMDPFVLHSISSHWLLFLCGFDA